MRRLLLIALTAACIVGCGEKSEPVPAQVVLNPGGVARTPQEQTNMDAHRQAGEKQNADMAAAAQQMAAARAKAGGH